MKLLKLNIICVFILLMNCNKANKQNKDALQIEVYETSAKGHLLSRVTEFTKADSVVVLKINSNKTFQTITGFGGAFTESSAYLLNRLSKKNRDTILQAYFGKDGQGRLLGR